LIKDSQKKARPLNNLINANVNATVYISRFDPLSNKNFNERLSKVNLPSLRTVTLPENDDFEVRVWIGFGQHGEDCFILRYLSGNWSAMHLEGMAEAPPFPNSLRPLSSPKSGWNNAWKKLTNAGILVLPNSEEVNCIPGIKDGVGYAVEYNKDMIYRTYHYPNPWYDRPPHYNRCNEAKQIILIGKIIGEEFGLELFDLSNLKTSQN
jgi:hypothetical protein